MGLVGLVVRLLANLVPFEGESSENWLVSSFWFGCSYCICICMGLRGDYGSITVIGCNYVRLCYIVGVGNNIKPMATDTWTPLWSKIVDSSIWSEPDTVRIVFITMLAKKDSDHIVRGTAFNIAKWANKSEAEVIQALKVLAAPDKHRIEKQPFDGRRIEKHEDGWFMLNGEDYRRKVSEEMRKARLRRAQNTYRAKLAAGGKPLPGETAYVAALEAGDTEKAEKILDSFNNRKP